MTTRGQVLPCDKYQADGFYIADGPVLPKRVVDAAAVGMDEIRAGRYDRGQPFDDSPPREPGDDPTGLCKIEQPQFANRAIFDVVSHADLGKLAAQVTGAKMVQVWWVQLLYKPSSLPGVESDTKIGWHQDRDYWTCWKKGSTLLTAWFALSDVGPDCGPMKFLRGSHRWGHQDGLSNFYGQDIDQQRRAITAQGRDWDEAPAIVPAGGVSFHDRLTFHGSEANHSGRPRRSLAIHLRTEQSWPDPAKPHALTSFIDQPDLCPVIYGSL